LNANRILLPLKSILEGFIISVKENRLKKRTGVNFLKLLSLAIVSAVAILGINSAALSQGKPQFKVGDRIECNTAASAWYKGTVVPFWDHDMYNGHTPDSGYFYRVKIDG